MSDSFQQVEETLRSGGASAGFDLLTQKFREEKNYPLLFEARLMQKRHELGLPLIQSVSSDELPEDKRRAYDEGFIGAAREVGSLFLADGNIPRAWPYLRAIGETASVAAAIESFSAPEGDNEKLDPVIEIAFHERVHPRRGFELILANYGICRAITFFDQYPDRKTREDSAALLVRTLHGELVESLKRSIARAEGQAPETRRISELIAGREWLFGEYAYYVDTSHLVSILRFSVDLTDRETLALAAEMTDYGKQLSSQFQYKGEPPFENIFEDYGIFLRALIGENVDEGVAHFQRKASEIDPAEAGPGPAQVLVGLLARLRRYPEAIEASLKYLRDVSPSELVCPTVMQLCEMAGDRERLKDLARERGDLLSFAAGALSA